MQVLFVNLNCESDPVSLIFCLTKKSQQIQEQVDEVEVQLHSAVEAENQWIVADVRCSHFLDLLYIVCGQAGEYDNTDDADHIIHLRGLQHIVVWLLQSIRILR